MTRSFAIVGSGPAGFYTAEALARKFPDAHIDILERLPTPFGLARFGVAPDHQGTKAITRVMSRLPEKPSVRFMGGVELGRDLSLDDLTSAYDAVVLATGAPADRRLGIPGEDLAGVFGSGRFVYWYNAHPDFREAGPDLANVESVAIIGNGNVAIDVARVLAKTPAEMAKSDLPPAISSAISAAPIRDIHIIGRRGPLEAAFTNAELAELGHLARCAPMVTLSDLPESAENIPPDQVKVKEANLATLRSFAAAPGGKPVTLRFHFNGKPTAFKGSDRLEAVMIEGAAGPIELPCQLAVTCIGYEAAAIAGVPFHPSKGIIANAAGRVGPAVYTVGWAARGPSGVIATNRQNGIAVAETIAADLATASVGKPGPERLDALLEAKSIRPFTWDDWKKIDAAEVAAAKEAGLADPPRLKFRTLAEIRDLLGR